MARKKTDETPKVEVETVDLGEMVMTTTVDSSPDINWSHIDTTDSQKVDTISVPYTQAGDAPALSFYHRAKGEIPAYATEESAGMDIRACLNEGDVIDYYDYKNEARQKVIKAGQKLVLSPGDRVLVPTGLHASIAQGFYLAIHPRSGTSWKNGLILTNGVGVVDSDYVAEIKVSLTNISGAKVVIDNNERIAQILLMPCARATTIGQLKSKPLQKTSRAGGFGSTGTK